jgi:hypothetical protein
MYVPVPLLSLCPEWKELCHRVRQGEIPMELRLPRLPLTCVWSRIRNALGGLLTCRWLRIVRSRCGDDFGDRSSLLSSLMRRGCPTHGTPTIKIRNLKMQVVCHMCLANTRLVTIVHDRRGSYLSVDHVVRIPRRRHVLRFPRFSVLLVLFATTVFTPAVMA